ASGGGGGEGAGRGVGRGGTAAKPTNDSISVVASCPTDSQPCGANGAQLAARAEPDDPATATTTTPISRLTRMSWAPVLARSPPAASASNVSNSIAATIARAR